MRKVSDALAPIVREMGLEPEVRLKKIRDAWAEKLGSPLSLHMYPVSLSGGELLVNVDSPPWRQEATFHRAEIMKRLAEFGVTGIRFKVGRVYFRAAMSASEPNEKPISGEPDVSFIEASLSGVKDPALKEAIRSAARKEARRAAKRKQ